MDIDPTVLDRAKVLARKRGKTLGETVSMLLGQALAALDRHGQEKAAFRWSSQRMGALVDLDDKDALSRILDGRD